MNLRRLASIVRKEMRQLRRYGIDKADFKPHRPRRSAVAETA